MSNILNKIPVSPITSFGTPSVPNGLTFGTNFSILQTGGYMEIYSLSGLTYTIPPATTGSIEFSGNSIPINFSKGTGSVFSPDVLTLNSDNISSGRRKLGMLVYVYETNKFYQFKIDNYDTLWNNATGATGIGGSTVVISDYGTTVKNNSTEGVAFIDAWTSSTISGINGYDDNTASWKETLKGVSITGATYFQGNTTFSDSNGGSFNVEGPSNYNPGVISGETGWSSNNDGSINLPQIRVALHDNPDFFEPLRFYSISSGTTGVGSIPALINNDTNYIIIEYNNGVPRYNILDNDGTVDFSSVILYMIVYRADNFVHVLEFGDEGAGLPSKLNERIVYTDRFARESGCGLGLSGSTGVVTLSSGVVWNGTNRQIVNDTTSLGIFFRNFHSGGTWVYTTTAHTINNLYYDDGTDLVLATAGKYLVNWYFRGQELNDHIYEVVSNGEFDSVLAADASSEPTLPELITSHAFLVGRIIIEVSATTGITQSAFSSVFQPSGAPGVHNDLTNIQGGLPNQYYHLDSNKYNNLALTNTNNNFNVGQSFYSGITATTISLPFSGGSVLFAGTSGQISQNNSQLFWDDTNNRLGIRTNTPAYPLQLVSTALYDTVYASFDYSGGTRGSTRITEQSIQHYFGSGKRFTLTRGGGTDSNQSALQFGPDATSGAGISTPNATSNLIVFNSNGTTLQETTRFTSTGNVLIGTTTDNGYKLRVNGTGAGLHVIGANSTPFTQTIASFVYGGNGNSINIENQGGKASIQAREGSSVVMNIQLNPAGGNVLIGATTDAGFKLDVNGMARINTLNIGLGGGQVATNTVIGFSAGTSNTTGSANFFGGYNAGFYNSSGIQNTAVGNLALYSNQTGNNNNAFGDYSFASVNTGSNNAAYGQFSGRWIANGTTPLTNTSNSVFIGVDSRANANAETNQIVIGYQAVGIGSNSVVLGNDNITKTALKGNVLIGTTTDSGYKLDVSGTTRVSGRIQSDFNATTIGTSANNHITLSQDGSVNRANLIGFGYVGSTNHYSPAYIGYQTTDFNSFTLGDLIFGARSATTNTVATEIMRIKSTGNVLIGTTTDSGYKLDVNGVVRATGKIQSVGFYININNGIGISSPATGMQFAVNDNGANIIGNSRQFFSFSNNGTVINRTSGTGKWFDVVTDVSFAPIGGSCTMDWMSLSPIINQTGGASGTTRGLYINPTLTSAADFRAIETTVGNVLLGSTSGNVGINTTAPAFPLQVGVTNVGSGSDFTVQTSSSAAKMVITSQSANAIIGANPQASTTNGVPSGASFGSTLNGGRTTFGFLGASAGGGTYLNFSTNGAQSGLHVTHNFGSDLLTVYSNGNTGIGTSTDAGFKLDVSGTARVSGVLTVGGNIVPSVGATYNVGSGGVSFSSGYFKNTVYSNQYASFDSHLFLANSGLNFARFTNATGNLIIQSGGTYTDDASARLTVNSTTQGFLPPRMTTVQKSTITTPATGLTVYDTTTLTPSFYNGTNWQNVLIPNSSGNTLIGTTVDAGFKLDVNGTARVNGNLTLSANLSLPNISEISIGTTYGTGRLILLNGLTTYAEFNVSLSRFRLSGLSHILHQTSTMAYIGTLDNFDYAFRTNNVERMRIFTTGNVAINTTTDVASSKLTIESTTQGFLPPRMTNAQRLLISTPAVGLMVYCTDSTEGLYINKSTGWTYIG